MAKEIDGARLDQILTSVWETAARTNPMLLSKLRPDYEFSKLREMIRDCLEKGLSETETREHALKELFRSVGLSTQPTDTCNDLPPQNGPQARFAQ
jgi:hypothetical protein